jgi:hypothetical protein
MRATLTAVSSIALFFSLLSIAQAATIDLPEAVVPGTAATGGPSFVIETTWLPDDSIRAIVSGTVDFNSHNSFNYSADWNAAGVVVQTRSTRLSIGGTDYYYIDQGWLRLAIGNDSLGFFPLFEVSEENGLGSSSPPETLILNRTVAEIFGSAATDGIAAGTILQYRIYDAPISDNTGAFVISTMSAVPELATWGYFLLGLGALGLPGVLRNQRRGTDAAV